MKHTQENFIKKNHFICPVCDSTKYSLHLNIQSNLKNIPLGLTRGLNVELSILSCSKCKLQFTSKYLEGYNYKSLYQNDSIYTNTKTYNAQISNYPKYSIDIIKLLSKYSGRKSVLEIGPFTGGLIKALNEIGFEAEGVELDPKATEVANNYGLKVKNSEIYDTYYDDKKYDIIVGIGVLEHIPDPVKWINRINCMLVSNGLLVLQFPNNRSLNALVSKWGKDSWDMYSEPGHIFFFSRSNIKKILRNNGFLVLSTLTATILTRGKIAVLPFRSTSIESAVRKINSNKYVFKLYAVLNRVLDIFKLGDTSIVVAKKTLPSRE